MKNSCKDPFHDVCGDADLAAAAHLISKAVRSGAIQVPKNQTANAICPTCGAGVAVSPDGNIRTNRSIP